MMATDLAWIDHIGNEAVGSRDCRHDLAARLVVRGRCDLRRGSAPRPKYVVRRTVLLVRRSVRIGLWVAILLWVPIMVLPLQGEQIVLALGHEPAIARLAQQRLFGLAWRVLPALWFLAIRSFMAAMAARTASAPFRDECRSAVHASVLFMAISSRSANER
ncbi:hypothetical protein [Bradyrhizobium sp. ERR14]|uniref:hypothetical protein n=1 Tax=Bradyrhizobium sp. ERR14 TaxID=2663837 RepID=UPI00160BCEEC|nr:hypothetical protein [Bradyrhizobium sp. ERR14]MBB4396547.1 hypothetical protein [Bradyrhizobium sp. ERR14]